MKALNAILGFLLFCVVLALGACLLYDGIMGSAFAGASCFLTGDSLLSRVLVGPVSRLAAGFSLVFVALAFALTALPAGRGERFISFKNAGGTVSVNVKAVTDYLARCGRGIPGVERVVADMASTRAPMEVLLSVHVRSGMNVPETCKMLQQHVRDSLVENLGIADIGNVRINVTEILAPESSPINRNPERPEW